MLAQEGHLVSNRLISADDHVDVSNDKIKSFLDPKYHGNYDDAFKAFRASMAPLVSNGTNERWREQQGLDASAPASGLGSGRKHRDGHTDPKARLLDLDQDGVEATVTYCEVSAFRFLSNLTDGGPQAARAFNTALLDWASADPARLVVNAQISIHDIDVAVAEVRWAASQGMKSLQLPVFPYELGLPDYWDSRYDPLWAAISDTGIPVCLHIGLNTQLEGLALRDPTPQKGIFVSMVPLSSAEALGQLLLTGVFARFPDLKVVVVEPGVGWVSWWLMTVDDMYTRQGYEFPGLKKLPSEYFRENMYLTFIDEPNVIDHARANLGIENIMWSSDYPHPVTSFPHSQTIAEQATKGYSEDEKNLVLSGNAIRVWGL